MGDVTLLFSTSSRDPFAGIATVRTSPPGEEVD
jgi:hypothetical protein